MRLYGIGILIGITALAPGSITAQAIGPQGNSTGPAAAAPIVVPAEPRIAAGTKYVLAPGDQIDVTVTGYPDLTISEVIRPDGSIGYPRLGSVPVAGLTTDQARAALAARLTTYILKPDVGLTIMAYHQEHVYVLGNVRTYGPQVFAPGMSASDALGLAGGPDEEADLESVKVERSHKTIAILNLLLADQAPFRLEAEDVVVVPKKPVQNITFVGAVARPGAQPLPPHERLLDALSGMAGITMGSASTVDLTHITLTRGTDVRTIDGKALLQGDFDYNIPLVPGDVISVPPAPPAPPAPRITVLGNVAKPGTQLMVEGELILDALTAVGISTGPGTTLVSAVEGGTPSIPDLGHVLLTRGGKVQTVDVASILTGTVANNIRVQDGDVIYVPSLQQATATILGEVAHPESLPIGPNMHVLDALNTAGGKTNRSDLQNVRLQRLGGKTLVVNLASYLDGSDTSQNPLLQNGDMITVPVDPLQVAVFGQVRTPGIYTFKRGDGVLQATLAAGGMTETAEVKAVRLLRHSADGQTQTIDVNMERIMKFDQKGADQALLPGDVIYVPTHKQTGTVLSNLLNGIGIWSIFRPFL